MEIIKKLLIALLFLAPVAHAATITALVGTQTVASSYPVINTNFTNLNDELADASVFDFPFTQAAYGVSTSTIVGFLGGMFSVGSSTIQDLRATTFTLGTLSGGLGANTGVVYAAATTTFTGSTGLTYANGNVTCDVATGSVPGCLSAANWTTFNNKQGSIAATYPITRSVNA